MSLKLHLLAEPKATQYSYAIFHIKLTFYLFLVLNIVNKETSIQHNQNVTFSRERTTALQLCLSEKIEDLASQVVPIFIYSL